jgi:hypothetical protein
MVRIGLIVVLGMLVLVTGLPEHQVDKRPPVAKPTNPSRVTLGFQVDPTVGTWKCRAGTNVCTLSIP